MNNISNWQKDFCKQTIFRLNKTQIGHFISYEKFHKTGIILGLLSILLTSLTSLLAVFEVTSDNDSNYNLYLVVCSILATIITTLHTYLNLEDRANNHKNRAHKYGVLKRKVETFLIIQNEDFEQFIKTVDVEWNHIAEEASVTPRRHRTDAKNIIKEDLDDYKKYVEEKKIEKDL